MSTFVFSSEEELLNQAKRDHACQVGLNWVKEQESLETIIKEIPLEYRIWCLEKGYSQFIDYCPWEELDGWDWRYLLIEQPQFSEFCFWNKLDDEDWADLCSKQPQLEKFRIKK